MKFTIDVEEFWLDGEQLEPALTQRIINEVVDQIEKSITKRVEDHITMNNNGLLKEEVAKLLIENQVKS